MFCGIEGRVGSAQHGIYIFFRMIFCNAQADCGRYVLVFVTGGRLADYFPNFSSYIKCIIQPTILKNDQRFFPSPPEEHVRHTNLFTSYCYDMFQNRITGNMPVGVISRLEMVNIKNN